MSSTCTYCKLVYESTHTCIPGFVPSIPTGWKCPQCQQINAPTILFCPNCKPLNQNNIWKPIANSGG